MLPALANHLWQSTLFAAAAFLLTMAMRRNHARVRHGVWLAASVKFLVPFSLLLTAGSYFGPPAGAVAAPEIAPAAVQISEPFALPSTVSHTAAPRISRPLLPLLAEAGWLGGCGIVLFVWWVRWRRIRATVQSASPLPLGTTIPAKVSASVMEPGVFGVLRPVLLLPQGITGRLTPEQLWAIVAHEMCHVRRRDNLTAALHMAVEAAFWFHPLVWWIGARLVDERERACDEEVLRLGSEPEAYAEGILNVCKFYLRSPLACASGVTGSDLKKRIEAIMNGRISRNLTFARKLLLAAAGATAVAAPFAIGIWSAPWIHAQANDANLIFEVASIKPADPSARQGLNLLPGGSLKVTGWTLRALITFAYDVQDYQVAGGPSWLNSARFDILARPERPETVDMSQTTFEQALAVHDRQRVRLRALLAERFQLAIHREAKELPVYTLVVARNGPKFQEVNPDAKVNFRVGPGLIMAEACTLEILTRGLTGSLGRPVMDLTNLKGKYDYKLEWIPEQGSGAQLKPGSPSPEPADPVAPSLFSVIQEQLGLKLEAGKGPVGTIVIDRAEKPTEN